MQHPNRNTRSTGLSVVHSVQAYPAVDLEDAIVRSFEGDREALTLVARELQPRLVREARLALGGLDHEADDVVQDLFVAILEGRVRAPKGRGEGLATLLRLVEIFARKHARDVWRFHMRE